MRYFVYADAAGYVTATASGMNVPGAMEDRTLIEVNGPVDIFGGPPNHLLDAETLEWVDPRSEAQALADAKVAKNAEIDAAREAANRTHFMFQDKHIAADDMSMKDILATNGDVQNQGSFVPGWPGGWKAMNGEGFVSIPDVATWHQFFRAMVAQGTANFAYSQSLKATLAAATTIAEVDAITWSPT
jgi:hypothetical protein